MCTQNPSQKKNFYTKGLIYLFMIVLGIVSGLSGIPFLENLGLTISDIFIKIFTFISLPIISLAIIVTLCGFSAEASMQKIWQRTLFYTLATTLCAATISCLLYLLIHPSNVSSNIVSTAPAEINKISYLKHISNIIPSNVFSPFIEHQVMGVLLLSILVGLAIRYIPEQETRKTVMSFFQGAHGVFLVLTRWAVAIIPLALYGFITSLVVELHSGINIAGIGQYLSVVLFANLIQGFIILPLWLYFNRINPLYSAKAMLPALSIAFFSKSSAGTLPVTMENAEKRLKLDSRVTRFVLPLCTTINMNGCAAFIFATVIYLMQNNGIEISLSTMGLWIFVATIAAVGNAGVPMGCFFLSTSLLVSMNVPITLMGIILPFYTMIDMIETALNVWSDSCVANVVNKKQFHSSSRSR
jgi:Na+/H+-dicarboxylate symporter